MERQLEQSTLAQDSSAENQAIFVRLTNHNGMEVVLSNFGAMIQQLWVPSKSGEKVDVVLGYDSISDYEQTFKDDWTPYHGAVVGRHAGRIANGQFTLHSNDYQIEQNLGKHHIHGASNGLSNVLWSIAEHSENTVLFSVVNAQLPFSLPGNLGVQVRYELDEENTLKVSMTAVTDADTLCNLTQHSYFNLNGHHASVEGLELIVHADQHVLVDADLIPTGELGSVKDTSFDFRSWSACPKQIDDSFVLNNGANCAASCQSLSTGIGLTIATNQPTLHVYVGGGIASSPLGKQQTSYHLTSGVCFEAQGFVDSPNHEHFPTTVLKAGETYSWWTNFKFTW